MHTPILEITGLNKTFRTQGKTSKVVRDLSLTIKRGEVFGFLGPNGAGKSTTIKLIMRFSKADSGNIKIRNRDITTDEFRHITGYLPEFPFFYDHLTAHETLFLSGRLTSVSTATLHERIPQLLARMNLEHATHQRVAGFSKGMKQRLGMANALVHDPDFLVFDEPMSGLDPLGRRLLKESIVKLRDEGKTVFFSSHILGDIEELCDRIGILHKGRLLYLGNVRNFTPEDTTLEECFVDLIHRHNEKSN